MKAQDFQQVRQAVGGRIMGAAPAGPLPIATVCTDTRKMERGSLFIALRGENFDGHRFLAQAAAGGAVAALVEEVPADTPPGLVLTPPPSPRPAVTPSSPPRPAPPVAPFGAFTRSPA